MYSFESGTQAFFSRRYRSLSSVMDRIPSAMTDSGSLTKLPCGALMSPDPSGR